MINNKKVFNWKTLPDLFFEEAKKQLDKPLLWYKINNQYKSYSWKRRWGSELCDAICRACAW